MPHRTTTLRSTAFTLLEVLVVVVVIGILAALVVPQFAGATEQAKSSALEGALGGVRSGIASFRSRAVISGNDPYPSLEELTTGGAVLESGVPINPYNQLSSVQAVSEAQADARAVSSPDAYGWNYFVDNEASPPRAVFYANSDEETTLPDGNGGLAMSNEL
ncbi:MAG: prepilin-type N-terminal cleavage/methylation domain-containing protein [Phycisphaeraceae bacterium]|nr:prepilin-type N-terminal cleavage/methylation domain-containing protein [Phycisphaeraceae bacterium]